MNVFTYRDYIKCIHTLRLNAVFSLADKSERYNLNIENKENKQEIKNILKSKDEMIEFINNFLDLKQKIKYDNLEIYDDKYIIRRYNIKQEKLVYKINNKEMFFLVDEVIKLDSIILYDILNYCISFIQEWNLKNKTKNVRTYPIIVPIIIYTGTEKIKSRNSDNNKSISDYILKNYQIKINYNLIDINKVSLNKLKKINTQFSNKMLIIKSKNKKDSKS